MSLRNKSPCSYMVRRENIGMLRDRKV